MKMHKIIGLLLAISAWTSAYCDDCQPFPSSSLLNSSTKEKQYCCKKDGAIDRVCSFSSSETCSYQGVKDAGTIYHCKELGSSLPNETGCLTPGKSSTETKVQGPNSHRSTHGDDCKNRQGSDHSFENLLSNLDKINDYVRQIDLGKLVKFYDRLESQKIVSKKEKLPNIIMIVIDTLRGDAITPENTPFIKSFVTDEKVSHFEAARAPATATAHSLFGLNYGILPHLRYQLIKDEYVNQFGDDWSEKRPYLQGSPFLALFKKLGYQIEVFARNTVEYHIDPGKKIFPTDSQGMFLQLNYSKDTRKFLNHCSEYDADSNSFPKNDLDIIKSFVERSEKHQNNGPVLSVIKLRGGHYPYRRVRKAFMDKEYYEKEYPFRWGRFKPIDMTKTLMDEERGLPNDKLRDPSEKKSVQGLYSNAVRSIDYLLWKTMTELKKQGKYEDSIIVTLSDHGEVLMDVNEGSMENRVGHGYLPYKQVSQNLLAIKLPDVSEKALNTKQLASVLDIYPTLLDYLGVDFYQYMNDLPVVGESLYSKQASCEITFQPTYDHPHRRFPNGLKLTKFTVDNGEEKFFLEHILENDEFTGKVKVLKHTNSLDEPIGNKMTKKEISEYLNTRFSSCLTKIFNSRVIVDSIE